VTIPRLSFAAVLLAARGAAAQAPAAEPEPVDKQLADVWQVITQDPAIHVDDPAIRPLAQALMLEGKKQLAARAFPQALANFLAAYAKFPSPRILLDIASALRDLGRLADTANTYQRYLDDPEADPERASDVKELLQRLDEQLTTLTVHAAPRGAAISIDGGPFIAVGGTLVTRVRPGIHLVRGTAAGATAEVTAEVTINGFEGEAKDVTPALQIAAPAAEPREAPDRVTGWLITGTQYTTTGAAGRERTAIGDDGRPLVAIVPRYEPVEHGEPTVAHADADDIGSGALGVVRIDGKGRGFAAGVGLAIARGRLETEVILLKSDEIGGYVGLRYRVLTGWLRPYAAAGVPGFVYDHDELQPDMSTMTSKRLAIGVRAAAGVEVRINHHLSVQGDLGYEHFFFTDDHYEADVFVPTVGVIGRL
jgi:hypothetical protein